MSGERLREAVCVLVQVKNGGFKLEVRRRWFRSVAVGLLSFAPGFSQVSEDTQLIPKQFKRFLISALGCHHLAEARC